MLAHDKRQRKHHEYPETPEIPPHLLFQSPGCSSPAVQRRLVFSLYCYLIVSLWQILKNTCMVFMKEFDQLKSCPNIIHDLELSSDWIQVRTFGGSRLRRTINVCEIKFEKRGPIGTYSSNLIQKSH